MRSDFYSGFTPRRSSTLLPQRRRCLSLCLSVSWLETLRKNFRTNFHEIFRGGWQWANEQMIKFWWRCGSPSGYRDCFPDSSPLGDTESGINRLRCTTLQCMACSSRRRHSNYDVITSPADDWQPRQTCHGGVVSCPSTSSL